MRRAILSGNIGESRRPTRRFLECLGEAVSEATRVNGVDRTGESPWDSMYTFTNGGCRSWAHVMSVAHTRSQTLETWEVSLNR